MARPDGWDQWVTERECGVALARAARYLEAVMVGSCMLYE